MRNQEGIYGRKIDTVFSKPFFGYSRADARINQYSVTTVAQIITISGASAPQAEKRKLFRRKKFLLHNYRKDNYN